MLSLLLIASFVMPSVLGQCCLPNTISAVIIEAGSNNPNDFLIDFSQKKFIFKPFDQSHVDFVLTDLNNGKSYQMNHDGTCYIHTLQVAASTYKQCLKGEDLAGSGYLGPVGVMNADTYVMQDGDVKSVISVTKSGCVPVVSIAEIGEKITSHFWTNVTTSVTDVSALDANIDSCTEEVVG